MSTETEIVRRLAKKYAPPEYAFLTQVRNGTGCARRVDRTADALAFSLWPSRGLSVSGFEIKTSKADMKREIANPEKAEAIAQYCDYWWVVVPDNKVLDDLSVPPAWGVMICDNEEGTWVVREATKTPATPLDRLMVCAIMRRAQEEMPKEVEIRKREKAAYEQGRVCGDAIKRSTVKRQQEEYDRLVKSIKEFHAATGIDLQQNYGLKAKMEEWGKLKKMMELSRSFSGGMPGLLNTLSKNVGSFISNAEILRSQLERQVEDIQWGDKR
jgi:hypothetical protein